MKVLETEITKSGFTYRQIRRQGNVAIYSQHLKGRSGKPLAYEVVVIKQHGEYTLGGVVIPAGESYPGNELFGKLGWSYSSLMKDSYQIAVDKFSQVVQSEFNSKRAKTK